MTTITTKIKTESTWEKIKETPLPIGTEISDTLKNGTPITFEVAALNIYGARKVLVCKDCLPEYCLMNADNTNKGGWKESTMRQHLWGIFEQLPDDLQAAIVPRTITQQLDDKLIRCADKLWLLSVTEVKGQTRGLSDSDVDDQQFTLYQIEEPIKTIGRGGSSSWWLRSPDTSNETSFALAINTGYVFSALARDLKGIAFGFLL